MPRHRPDEWSRPRIPAGGRRATPRLRARLVCASTLSSHYSSLPQSRTRAASARSPPCPREPAAYSPAGWPASSSPSRFSWPPAPAPPARRSRPRRSPSTSGRRRGQPGAVILALHGFGDAGDLTFEGAARAWSARGIAVYAPDQRGFGANASRHDWPGADALAGDAAALSRWLRARYPGVPLVVVGHSMGGGVALAAAAQRPRRRRPRPRRPRHRRRRRAEPPLPHRRPHRRRRRAREALDRQRPRRDPPHRQPRGHRPRRRRPPPLRRPHEPRALRPRPAHGRAAAAAPR